jgi:hypothetical protein
MTRRRVLLLGSVAVVAACAIVVTVWPRTEINRWNAARIEKGMTRAEVEGILGGPHRQECEPYPIFMFTSGRQPEFWGTPQLLVCVWFDNNDRVHTVRLYHDDGPLELIRHWLRL